MLALVPMLGGLALVVAYGIAIANANEHVSAFGVAVVAAIVIGFIAVGVTTKEDKKWLPTMIMAGFTAKLIASTVRWWVLVDFYEGSGDAVGYHKFGHEYVHLWRTFHMPPMASGTEAMEGLVGLVYVPYAPNFLGGFYMFATLAFIGQIFCYMAFRNATVPRRNKLYAVAIFFVPTIVYWPSSIGKESVIVLGLGIAAYGLSRVLAQGSFGSLVTIVDRAAHRGDHPSAHLGDGGGGRRCSPWSSAREPGWPRCGRSDYRSSPSRSAGWRCWW